MISPLTHPDLAARPSIGDLSLPELTSELRALGQPDYRARQVWHGFFCRLARSYDELVELPRDLRGALARNFRALAAEKVAEQSSADGSTQKALLQLGDGELIETVLMCYPSTRESRARNTVCISTQAGCAMACSFCATGQQGFRRNLTAGEIVEQVLYFARGLRERSEAVTNVVFMGMGEPLANYAATLRAIATLNSAEGFALGARHMTVSTVGVLSGIRRLAREPYQVGLALSLHAPNDALRRRLIPTARQPIDTLLAACDEHARLTGRRYSVEYALIEGVNDTPPLARDLGRLLQAAPCHVNLIPVNPTANDATHRPSRARVLAFQGELLAAGINCTVRVEKGVDIAAGCGQLRGAVTA